MHHLVTSSLCLGLLLYPAYLELSGPVRPIAVAQNSMPESRDPIRAESEGAESPTTVHMSVTPPENPIDVTCQTLGAAALENGLPLEFLTRLIWQESRFDAHAVSSAGAQGIAQFMPATATGVGLANPFDPAAAIIKSAALLRDLKQRFGNLGLAAAAYNAGPNRVADWLARRRGLPRETQAYVKSVTGHHPDEWTTVEPKQLNLQLPSSVPCPDLIKLFAIRRPVARKEELSSAAVSPHRTCLGGSTCWQFFGSFRAGVVSSAPEDVQDRPTIATTASDLFASRNECLLVPDPHWCGQSRRCRKVVLKPTCRRRNLSRTAKLKKIAGVAFGTVIPSS